MRRSLLFITTCLLIFPDIPKAKAMNLGNNHNTQYARFFAVHGSISGLQLDANPLSNLRTTVQVVDEQGVTNDFSNIVNWVRISMVECHTRPVSDSIVMLEATEDTPNSTGYINLEGLNKDIYMVFRMKVNEQQ